MRRSFEVAAMPYHQSFAFAISEESMDSVTDGHLATLSNKLAFFGSFGKYRQLARGTNHDH